MVTTEKYKPERLIKIFEDYIANTELPILKEVCVKNDLSYDYIKQMKCEDKCPELTHLIKKLLWSKEVEIAKGIMTGKYNCTAGIFWLKQLGWRDYKDEPKNNMQRVVIINDLEKSDD